MKINKMFCLYAFNALYLVDGNKKIILDSIVAKAIAEKVNKTTFIPYGLGTARSNSSNGLDGLSEEELYFYNLYLEFVENANIYPVEMKSLLDRMFNDYDKLIPAFVNGAQSEVNLNLDLFWLDKMSPGDSTYRSGIDIRSSGLLIILRIPTSL